MTPRLERLLGRDKVSSYNSQKETDASKSQAGTWGLAPGHLEGTCGGRGRGGGGRQTLVS